MPQLTVVQLIPKRHPAGKLGITRNTDLIFLGRATLMSMIDFWQFHGGPGTEQKIRALVGLHAHAEKKPVLSSVRPRDYFWLDMVVAYAVTLPSHLAGGPPLLVRGHLTHCSVEDYRLTIQLRTALPNGNQTVACRYADPRVLSIWDWEYLRAPSNARFTAVWLRTIGRDFKIVPEEFLRAIAAD